MRARARDLPSFLVRSRTLFLSSLSLSLCACVRGDFEKEKARKETLKDTKNYARGDIFFRSFSFFFWLLKTLLGVVSLLSSFMQ